jgi:protein SCO1/2
VSVRPLPFALLGAAMLFVGCGKQDAVVILQPQATPAELQKYWAVPDFSLIERSGKALGLADLTGKVWVADFFYTSCPGPCPALQSRFTEVQKALGPLPDVRFVSISVDPEKDNTEVLKDYAKRFNAGPDWLFCTGERDTVYNLAHDGFKLPIAGGTPEAGPVTHTTRLILIDRTGMVRGFYEGTTDEGVQNIVRDIRRLLAEK